MAERAEGVVSALSVGFLSQGGDIGPLIGARGHAPAFAEHRAHVILSRVHVLAILFAILTPAWIAVDAVTFPSDMLFPLALERVAAAAGFLILIPMYRLSATTGLARAAIVVLLAIPGVFYLFTRFLLQSIHLDDVGQAAASAYLFLPFVLMGGLGLFPLTLWETIGFSGLVLAVALIPLVSPLFAPMWLPMPAAWAVLWLLALVGAISALAAMIQLRLMMSSYRGGRS